MASNWPHYSKNNDAQNLQLWLSALQQVGKTAASIGQNWQQNTAANQAMNTQIPPRAALVDAYPGDGPAAENNADFTADNPQVPTSGSAPFTGGKAGMAAYLQLHQQGLKDQQAQLNQQYRLSQIEGANNRNNNSVDRLNLAQDKFAWQQQQAQQNQQNKSNQIPDSAKRDLSEIDGANQFVNDNLGTDLETAQKYSTKWVPDPNNPTSGNMINPELSAKVGKTLSLPKSALDRYGPEIYKANATYQYYKKFQPELLNNAIQQRYTPSPSTVASDQQVLQSNNPTQTTAGQNGKYQSQMSGNDVVNSILPKPNQSTPQAQVPQPTPDNGSSTSWQ